MAIGFTADGAEPALCTRARSPNRARASPSANWLRAEFATHRKRMDFIDVHSMTYVNHEDTKTRRRTENNFGGQIP